MKYNIFVLVVLLFTMQSIDAQTQAKHEFQLWAGGGYSILKPTMNLPNSTEKGSFGAVFGLGYNYHLMEQWSIKTGVELASYKTNLELIELNNTQYTRDYDDSRLYFNYKMDKYEEDLSANFINIPLMVQFQTLSEGNSSFYLAIGGKIGLPMNGKGKSKATNFTTTGYFPEANLELTEPEVLGFGEFERSAMKNDLSLKTVFMASLELGMRWRLSDNCSLYTGAYADYGLNNVANTQNKSLVGYNLATPSDHMHTSIVAAQFYDKNKEREIQFVNKIAPLSVGMKISISLMLGQTKNKKYNKKRKQIRKTHMQKQPDTEAFRNMSTEEIQKRVNDREEGTFSTDELKDQVRKYKGRK